ncbi:MAG TPA: 16S rRNA (adenine(1518)-N(6)/adenine(1519)-N(6))-dimethyltransferase RsmA [Alphaproteobacteria bacterium]|nr:16S rRNA (adenine(1518)-N(6)/adenine(1519)-N(6))-dimethyltransferase RsmA [Alphaproteobacteria bacterium]
MTAGAEALPPLRDVIARYGLGARKRLGQHFLLDPNLTARIARAAAPLEGFDILEVGPGPGGLTRALLARGARRVVAIERDVRFMGALADLGAAYPGRLTLIEGDALEIDARVHLHAPAKVVANLPYNAATELLLRWLKADAFFDSFTLMFQKEVASRLTATPGTKAYGRLSVATQWRCRTERLFDISPRAFIPPPKVTSTVVRLTPRETRLAPADPVCLEEVTAAAFGQRRKMLRSSLKTLGVDTGALLTAAGVDGRHRVEDLEIEKICALANALVELR